MLYIIIAVVLIALIGVLLFFKYGKKKESKDYNAFFKSFSAGLAELQIENTEVFIDVEGYDIIEARGYRAEGKSATIYVLDKKSSKYNSVVKTGTIRNNKNPDYEISGVVVNEYLFALEEGFPKDYAVYELFEKLAKE